VSGILVPRFEPSDEAWWNAAVDPGIVQPLPSWRELRRLGRLMEALLGSRDDGRGHIETSVDTASFPAVARRVETLSVLSEQGERRELSLDLWSGFLRGIRDDFQGEFPRATREEELRGDPWEDDPAWLRPSGGDEPGGRWRTDDLGEWVPVPFGIFSKGILRDFSAKDDAQALPLLGKTLSFAAGLAWVLVTVPRGKLKAMVVEGVFGRVVAIVQRIVERVVPGGEFERIGSDEYLVKELWNLDRLRLDASDPSWVRAQAFLRAELLYSDPDEAGNRHLTTFFARLKLLTSNYFPLLLVVPPASGTPRFIVKLGWTYGRSAEEWLAAHSFRQRWKDPGLHPEAFFDEAGRLRAQSPGRVVWGGIRGHLLPYGPWPYDMALFGPLEGHSEHLNVEMPPGVELASTCYERDWLVTAQAGLPLLAFDPAAKEACADRKRHRRCLPVQQVLKPWFSDDNLVQIREHSHVKAGRHVLSIRRRAGMPRGWIQLRMAIVPSLDAVFTPAAIGLGVLLAVTAATMVAFVTKQGRVPDVLSGGIQASLPYVVALITGSASVLVSRSPEALQSLMLRPLLLRVQWALIGVAAAFIAWLVVGSWVAARWPSPIVPGAPWETTSRVEFVVLLMCLGYAAYAFAYLVGARLILWRARWGMDDWVGHTERLLTIPTAPAMLAFRRPS